MSFATFKLLKSVRNPLANSQGTIGLQDKLDWIACINYIKRQ